MAGLKKAVIRIALSGESDCWICGFVYVARTSSVRMISTSPTRATGSSSKARLLAAGNSTRAASTRSSMARLQHADLLGGEGVLAHRGGDLLEGTPFGREVGLDDDDVEAVVGRHDLGEPRAAQPEGRGRDGGRQGGPADRPWVGLAGGGAERPVAVRALDRHLARHDGGVFARQDPGPRLGGRVERLGDDVAGLDALFAQVPVAVPLEEALHLFVGDLDGLDQRGLPALLAQLLAEVLAEGLVGEAGAGDQVQVGLVVRPTVDAAAGAELGDGRADVAVGDALTRGVLADDLLADEGVDEQELEVRAHLALGDGDEERVRAGLGDLELADRLAVDAQGDRARVARAAGPEAEGGREGDDHPEQEPDRDEPEDDRVGATAELHGC